MLSPHIHMQLEMFGSHYPKIISMICHLTKKKHLRKNIKHTSITTPHIVEERKAFSSEEG